MLYDELSAEENLRYFAGLYRTCSCLTPSEALLAVGLDPTLTRPVGQFSQGMRQRTSLARVLLPQPELLLLDEPFSNMDAASAGKMVALLGQLRAANRTVVLTTHQRSLAEPLADYFLTMEAGQLISTTEVACAMKTNAARILEGLGIAYTLQEYEVDPEDLSAINVARKIGLPVEQVFKTLLTMTGPDQYAFAVIPGDAELDFKKLARAAGARKAEMVSLKDVQPLTGYIRGGVTVFGAKKDFPVFADETIELFDLISVSAGQRGVQVLLAPAGLPARFPCHGRCLDQGSGALVSYLLIHLAKDLRLEWRSKDAINGMLFFALLVVVLFSLAFDPTAALSRQIAGRHPVRCYFVRFGDRAEPGVDARTPPPGAGCTTHGAGARILAVPG